MLEICERLDKVKAPDFTTQSMIETVRRVVVCVAIKHKNVALFFPRHLLDSLDQRGGDSSISIIRMHNEVIDFHVITAPDFRTVPYTGEAGEPTIDIGPEDTVIGKLAQNFFIATLHGFLAYRWVEIAEKFDNFRHGRDREELQIHISGKWQ